MSALSRDDLLILLIEECGEVIQAATKCLRFGYFSDHGTGYGHNDVALSREIGEVQAIVGELPLNHFEIELARSAKIARAERAKNAYALRTPLQADCGVVCQASRDDGVCCADDECDRENGVRPAAEATPTKEDFAKWSREWHDTCETILTLLDLPGGGSPQETLAQVQAHIGKTSTGTGNAA